MLKIQVLIRIFQNTDIFERNSFHVHELARRIVEFDRAEELCEVFEKHVDGEWMALGGGNNILFTSSIDRVLVVPCDKTIQILDKTPSSVLVRVGAGVEWDDLVEWCTERNLWGVENLSLIPGKVGAAPVQNIGAYGAEAKDVITSLSAFFPENGSFLELDASQMRFAYRDSIFKHEYKGKAIITSVVVRLSRHASPKLQYADVEKVVESMGGPELRNIRNAICAIRRRKLPDPAVTGNAGSFFKNPVVEVETAQSLMKMYPDMPHYATEKEEMVKLSAAWLIDHAGLKGFRGDNVGVHPFQALVLVNLGNANGNDVVRFAGFVKERVFEKFGIEIVPEVNII